MTIRAAPKDHYLVWSCCAEIHYETTAPIAVGEIVEPEVVRRVCARCPDPAHGLALRCHGCGAALLCVSLDDGMQHGCRAP